MTTIAYDAKTRTLAADSKTTDGDNDFPSRKIWRLTDGRLFGAAGDNGLCDAIYAWLEDGAKAGERPELIAMDGEDPSFSGLLVGLDGRVYHLDAYLVPMEVLRDYHAIGTGARLASRLMEHGKSAKEAVALIVELGLDEDTGGPVQELQLVGSECALCQEQINGRQKH